MPTNTNAYNSRVTDEALEKRFRDTFRSQGGAELVDDLYAQGVIVPIVDFTAAATGQQLQENLQTAWDFTTGNSDCSNANVNIITNAGFWLINLSWMANVSNSTSRNMNLEINDGATTKTIWRYVIFSGIAGEIITGTDEFTVFVRSGDTVRLSCSAETNVNAAYRQIATVNGDLVDPSGFTSS